MISAALAVLESEEQRNELSEIYENNISNFYNIAFQQLHNKHDAEDAICLLYTSPSPRDA